VVYDVVEGFGTDIPLVMAMGQIIPAKYAYSFGKGVNPGSVVSWEGGKPWNEVLHSVLTPLNIGVKIEGTVVSLSLLNPVEQPAETPAEQEIVPKEQKSEPVPAPVEEKTITPEPVVQEEKAENVKEEKQVKSEPETLTPPVKEEEKTADAVPEEEEEETLVPLTEADKTNALQEEQLKKIQSSNSELNPSEGDGNIIKQESERYNLSSSAQSEQKKNHYSASSIR
jgi:outer membrane biosynthesis protein TonB